MASKRPSEGDDTEAARKQSSLDHVRFKVIRSNEIPHVACYAARPGLAVDIFLLQRDDRTSRLSQLARDMGTHYFTERYLRSSLQRTDYSVSIDLAPDCKRYTTMSARVIAIRGNQCYCAVTRGKHGRPRQLIIVRFNTTSRTSSAFGLFVEKDDAIKEIRDFLQVSPIDSADGFIQFMVTFEQSRRASLFDHNGTWLRDFSDVPQDMVPFSWNVRMIHKLPDVCENMFTILDEGESPKDKSALQAVAADFSFKKDISELVGAREYPHALGAGVVVECIMPGYPKYPRCATTNADGTHQVWIEDNGNNKRSLYVVDLAQGKLLLVESDIWVSGYGEDACLVDNNRVVMFCADLLQPRVINIHIWC